MARAHLTERQEKWFASVRDGLERDTGRSLADWVAIARGCPETAHRARLRWFKDIHGLLQNRASYVISEAFGDSMPWREPDALIDALWTDPASRALMEAVDARISALPEVIQTARKGYTAWSRKVQFAALRPLRGGRAAMGLAVCPDADPRLTARGSDSWSERLTARLTLQGVEDVDAELLDLVRTAWSGA